MPRTTLTVIVDWLFIVNFKSIYNMTHGFKLLTRYLSQMSSSQGGFNCLMVEDVLFWGFLSVETTIKYFIKSKLTLQLTHAFILLSISLLNCQLKKGFLTLRFRPLFFYGNNGRTSLDFNTCTVNMLISSLWWCSWNYQLEFWVAMFKTFFDQLKYQTFS